MKYAFILNPASGQGKHDKDIIPAIRELMEISDKDIKLYLTEGPGDAAIIADMIAAESDEDVVVFACGGDGTINEVANGLYLHDNAILGVVPVGSGNDFVRSLGGGKNEGDKFLDIAKYIDGTIDEVDLIKMTFVSDGQKRSRVIVNGLNIGFDGNTAVLAHELKTKPLISGSMSYLVAAAINLAAKKGEKLRITADGELFWNGKLLLATVANGGFCGGGVESCPRADMRDGLGELLVVRDLSRRRFVTLFPKYAAGKLLEIEDVDKYIRYRTAKQIVIEPLADNTMTFVADGEIFTTGALKIEMLPKALRVMNFE